MAATSVGNTPYILKTLWPQERVENLVYEDNPFLALVPKSEEFYGQNMYLAVKYTDTQGRSATFSTAQGAKNPHKGVRFLLTRGKDYSLFGIEHEMILASKKDKGALLRALDTEVESAMHTLSRSLAIALYRDASGQRGQVKTNPGGATTFTLKLTEDETNFEVGTNIVFAATTTGALRAGGNRTITAIDRDAGVITVGAGLDASVVANDVVFIDGDAANGSSTILPTGLLGWLPSAAPTSGDNFFGVDRSADPVRLAGLRIDVSPLNPEEGLVTELVRICREGGKPSHLLRNPIDWKNISVALGSKVRTEYMEVGDIGFTALKVDGPKGQAAVVSDQNCPRGIGFDLTMKSWKFYSLGKAPMVIEADDLQLLRDSTADSFEGRMAYYANTGCVAPGWNGNIVVPT
jgi:hypothetical protein